MFDVQKTNSVSNKILMKKIVSKLAVLSVLNVRFSCFWKMTKDFTRSLFKPIFITGYKCFPILLHNFGVLRLDSWVRDILNLIKSSHRPEMKNN
jgi:hypothetical protein